MIPIAMIYSLIFVFPIIGAFGYAMNIVGNDSEPVGFQNYIKSSIE